MRSILAAFLAASVVVPTAALAGHMTNYAYNPMEHDDQGRVDEPDFLSTDVLGTTVRNCFVELPTAQGFGGRCTSPDLAPLDGQAGVLAPGCTGEDEQGNPVRRPSGTCGLWTVGAGSFLGPTPVGPGVVPEPVSERGLEGARAPGAFTPTKESAVRFLDLRIIWSLQPLVSVGANTHQVEVNRKLADAGALAGRELPLTHSVLPGSAIVHVWFGRWADLNGNGVVDHFTPRPGGPPNEYAWLGSCTNLKNEREVEAIRRGLCQEDPNPNASPPGTACGLSAELAPCAKTTVHTWLWPGTHTDSGNGGEAPGGQVGTWLFNGLSCDGQGFLFEGEECDDVGDPLLGVQDARTPDIVGELDTTGELADSVRRWYAGTGHVTPFYGDDGLLITLLGISGANCGIPAYGFPAWDLDVCTYTDVDRHEAISPLTEELLVGSANAPTGGLKGDARAAWVLVRELPGQLAG